MTSPPAHFADRRAAGRLLGARLLRLALRNPAVIALSPGGIHVGFEVARALDGELGLIAIPEDGPDRRLPRISSLEILRRAVVLVDDGTTAVATILATIAALDREGAASVVLAIPVLPGDAVPALESSCDEVVCLVGISNGERVEDQYHEFHDVSRSEAIHLLHDARDPHSPPAPPLDVSIAPDGAIEAD